MDPPPLAFVEHEGPEAVGVQAQAAKNPIVREAHHDLGRDDDAGGPALERIGQAFVQLGVGRREVRHLRGRGHADLHLRIRDHTADPLHDLLRIVSRQHPAIDVGDGFGRNDIALFAALEHVDREGGSHKGGVVAVREEARAESRIAERLLHVVVAVGLSRRHHRRHPREELLGLRQDSRLPLGFEEPRERPDEPVRRRVGPWHGPVTWLATRREPEREPGLLGDHDGAEGRPPVRGLDHAELGERVLRAVEPGAALICYPLGAEPAPGFLVRRPEKDQVALERDARPLDGEHGRQLENAGGLHVDGAAAVHEPVLQGAAEGIDRPVALVRVDHVDVVVEQDGAERAVTLESGDQVAPAGGRLGGFARDAGAVEHLGEEARPRGLVPRRVRGVDTQVATQQLDRLVADLRPVHHARVSSQCRPGLGRSSTSVILPDGAEGR